MMRQDLTLHLERYLPAAALLAALLVLPVHAQEHGHQEHGHPGEANGQAAPQEPKPTDSIVQVLFQAERALEKQELQLAESHYRGVLFEGWMLTGLLEIVDGDLEAARDAVVRTTQVAATGQRIARTALALVQLWTGEIDEAVATLGELAARRPADLQLRVQHVHALLLAGRMDEARQEIDALRPQAPEFLAKLEETLAATADDEGARRAAFLPRIAVGSLPLMSEDERAALRAVVTGTLARTYRNLGVLYELLDRPLEAAAHFAEADALEPPASTAAEPSVLESRDLRESPPSTAIVVQPLGPDETILWQTAKVHLMPAIQAIRDERRDEAEAFLRETLEKDAGDASARDMLALLLAGREEYGEAEEQLKKALATDPEKKVLLHLHQHLGRLHLARGQEKEAAAELRQAAEIDTLDFDLALKLVEIEEAAGNTAAAREILEPLVRKHASTRAFLKLAELSWGLGPKASLSYLVQASGLAPNSEEALGNLANTYLAVDEPEKALAVLERLMAMHPGIVLYERLLAEAHTKLGDLEAALADLRRAVELEPDHHRTRVRLSGILIELGRYDEAERELRTVLDADPERPDAKDMLTVLEERRKETTGG